MPHHLLLTKLCTLGFDFDFINLFTSYLNDRRLCIKLEDSLSDVIDVNSGPPLGSVLGPLLFCSLLQIYKIILKIIKRNILNFECTLPILSRDPRNYLVQK